MTIFKLPDLGEGLPDAELGAWHVAVGQSVEVDQLLVSVETAKALVDIPSPYKGKVLKLYGVSGDIIKTGANLIEIELLEAETLEGDHGTVAGKLRESGTVMAEPVIPVSSNSKASVQATPAVRALAKKLKVDLTRLTPADPKGLLTRQEVEMAAKDLEKSPLSEKLIGVRRRMARVMQEAHDSVAQVTLVEDAKLYHWDQNQDLTVLLIQAIIRACQQEPALNAWYDSVAQSRFLKSTVNMGIAFDTKEGLFVPVIEEAETLNAAELRVKIEALRQAVSSRKILPAHLQGATITLSNFGKFTGRYATPMVVPPMVAIVAAGRMREEMVIKDHTPMVCGVLPLSLSFDHRVVTGGEAARFLSVIIEYLENP